MSSTKRILFTLSLAASAFVQRCQSFSAINVPRRSSQQKLTIPGIVLPSVRSSATCLALQKDSEDPDFSLSTPLDRPVLAAVDLVSLLVFAGVGKASHAPDGSLDILAVASVAFPFVLSWFLTSPVTGVYTADERGGNLIQDAFLKTGKGWIVAIPLGCVLRGIIKGYVPPLPFVVVTLIATLFILGAARVLFAVAEDFFVEFVN